MTTFAKIPTFCFSPQHFPKSESLVKPQVIIIVVYISPY